MDAQLSRMKILLPDPELYTSASPVRSYLSFAPYYHYLKKRIAEPGEQIADFLQYIVDKLEKTPILLQPISKLDLLDEHTRLFELIAATLFPFSVHKDLQYYALSTPFRYEIFFYSKSYGFYFKPDEKGLVRFPPERPYTELEKEHEVMAYRSILSRFYGVEIRGADQRTHRYLERKTGLQRYSRLHIDESFIEVKVDGELPKLPEHVINRGAGIINDIEALRTAVPLSSFRFEGFLIRRSLVDVTVEQCIAEVRNAVLDMNANDSSRAYDQLKSAVETLAEMNPVEVSLVPFLKLNERYVLSEPYAQKSMLLQGAAAGQERAQAYARLAAILNETRKPVFIQGRDRQTIHHGHAGFLNDLAGSRDGSFIISPHFDKEELLGMVEIHAPEALELGPEILGRLEPVFSYFELAFRNNITSFRNSIGTLVKEQFTSLQKVVEWKFNEVAWEYLKGRETGAGADLGTVHFDQVYPLYGAVDVRNSSVERNACTRRDLSEQLQLIGETVLTLQDQHTLALQDYLENIRYKNNAFLECLKGDIHSEDEIRLNEYLEQEIKSLFRHLSRSGGAAQEHALKYLQSVDPAHGHLFNHRRRFDQSIGMLNTAIEHFLVHEQDKIQQVFPHYFEKFRTDGIEYNIYIGETIAPRRNFDYLHLKNLRLWQLSTMVETARLTHSMQDSLPLPLQTTQLILLYNNPIAISFRKDEKRFDVEGGANIRYEIIKKRIDKAVARDSGERLTQPGKVAIVFTQGRDMTEYEEYIHFLRNKGSLEDGVEQFELADMQGISGLKAIRVTVKKK